MGSVLKSCIIAFALYWEERFERRYGFWRRVTRRLKKKDTGSAGIGEFHPASLRCDRLRRPPPIGKHLAC